MKLTSLSCVSSAALLLACASAAAQDQAAATTNPHATDESTALGEVIVTATKRNTRVQDTPVAISVLSGETLQKFNLNTFTDYAKIDPALQFSSNGIGDSRMVIRGIQSAGAATVSLYLDEAVITGQTFENAFGGRSPDIGLHDIDRIEVLKGPQGTLFGASAMSGSVRIITKKPDLENYSGAISAGISDGKGTHALYDGDAMVNIPIVKDKLAARLVWWANEGGGYIDDVSSGANNVNDQTIWGLRGSVMWKPIEALTITASDTYQNIKVDGSQRFQAGSGDYNNPSPTLEPYGEYLNLASVVADYDLGFGDLVATSSYLNRKTAQYVDTTPTATGYGLPGDYDAYSQEDRTVFSNELRFASRFKGPLQVVGGLFYEHDNNYYATSIGQTPKDTDLPCHSFSNCQAGGYAGSIVSAREVFAPFSQYAVFGQADYKLTSMVTLTAGVRYFRSKLDHTEYTLQSLRYPGSPTQATGFLAEDETEKDNKFTYNFAATFKPTRNLTTYARAASGFRQGGINNSSFAANFGTTIPAGFKPDSLWNYEVGAKATFFDGKVSIDSALYRIDWKSIQVPGVSENGAFGFTVNAGKARVNGAEFEIHTRPITGLSVNAGATYTDAKLTEDQPDTESNDNAAGKKGDHLPFVGKWNLTAQAEYDFPITEGLQGYVRGDANYRAAAHNFFNNENPFYYKVGDYFLADVGAGVRYKNWDLGLLVQNVTNKVPVLSAEVEVDGYRITTVRPRTFGLRASTSF